MNTKKHSLFWRSTTGIAAFGLLAFALLAIRFSPNWVAFCTELGPVVSAASPEQSDAVDKAIFSGHSERGYHVTRQARDLDADITESNHRIVRWRLLVPALAFVLNLRDWATLGIAHLGCVVLVWLLVSIGARHVEDGARPPWEAMCLGVVAGASAPVFTSLGWLGYYDSWLASALLAVAFSPRRWVVVAACLLAPWIDERFVIGLPLALLVRRLITGPRTESVVAWMRGEALIPLLLALGYGAVRLKLGGSSGSQTVGGYLDEFVRPWKVSFSARAAGAWEGLRVGWLLVAAAVLHAAKPDGNWRWRQGLLFTGAILVTGTLGLATALDLNRAMVLLISVVPLGWIVATQQAWWRRFWVGPTLAALALLLPARHFGAVHVVPVDCMWAPSLALITAENNLGVMYASGNGGRRDAAEAVRWFRRAALHGSDVAQYNLAIRLASGDGVERDRAEAVRWMRAAAEHGFAPAQNSLGLMLLAGDGAPKDTLAAIEWFRRAAAKGDPGAQNNLGAVYALGNGVAKDVPEALRWFHRAAAQGYVDAQKSIGLLLWAGDGVAKDEAEGFAWISAAADAGHAEAVGLREQLRRSMSPEEQRAAQARALQLRGTGEAGAASRR